MSRLNVKDSSTYGNVNTHVFTEFSTLNKEDTQKQVLQAIKDINISAEIGQIIVESSDTITHEKLDVINATIDNKHLNSGFDSVEIGSVAGDLVITTTVDNFPGSFAINNFPLVQEVSGTVNVSNAFSTEDTLLTTNDKLDTINTTITDKHLNSSLDSVNVNKVVESVFYNLDYVGSQMYADSINGAVIDQYGRDGWLWGNEATTGGSNCYWYSNSIIPQNHMTKEQIDCVYVILALDRVEPAIVLPFVPMYSEPTGSGDHIPGFAHSVWTYTIPATHILNAGEVIMLTIGDHTKVDNIRPELRRVHLELNSTEGSALPTENIAYISLNTDSGLKPVGAIQYLLQNAGFHYSVNNKITDYEFNNGVQKYINDNLTTQGIKIRGDVNVTGTVNVGNFPPSFEVSNFPSSYAVSSLPSVEINNFPDVQTIDGTVNIGNYPDIQTISGNVAIDNFPDVQTVDGFVSIQNFPTTQAVTGTFWQNTQPVSISETVPVSGTFWQNTQPISGSISNSFTLDTTTQSTNTKLDTINTTITNKHLNKTTDSIDISGQSVVVNTISGYATETTAQVTNTKLDTLNTTLTNKHLNKVNDSVDISGQSVNVNTISGFALDSNVSTTNTKLDTLNSTLTNKHLSKVNDSVDISGQSVTVNTISGFALDSNVSTTNTKLDTLNTTLTNKHLSKVSDSVDISGQSVTVNTISGFALESGGNLASIKTNTEKIKSDTVHTDAIQVEVKNTSVPVNVGNFPSSTNSHLQAYDPTLTGYFDLTSTGIGVNTSALDVAVKNTVSVSGAFYPDTQPVSGSVSVSNTSLDTHLFASSNGTNWHHLKSDSNGILNTHSMMQDGAGTDITSTLNGSKQSLDVNVSNTVPVSGSFYPATQPISGTVGISGTVPVSGSFYQATQPVSIAGTVAVSGSFYQTVQPISGSVTVSNTIPVTGYVDAYLKDGAGNAISSTSSAINSYLTNTNTTNNIITGAGSGLSMYVIPSKTKTFLFNAYSGSSAANAAIGAVSNTQTFSGNNWGIANPRNTWNVVRTGLTASAVFNYTYVDGSGNETVGTPITLSTTSPFALANGIVTVNSWYINATLGTGDSINVSSTSNINTSWGSGSYLQQNNSLWTCPNNCIAWVANIAYYSSTADALRLFKWDAAGNRTIMYGWYNASNFTSSASGEYGFGGYIKAGETIGWGGEGSNIISRVLHSNIVCKYL